MNESEPKGRCALAVLTVASFLLLLAGCGSSEVTPQQTQSKKAIDIAEEMVETSSLIARDGRIRGDRIGFPPATAKRVRADLKTQQNQIYELVDLPARLRENLTNARKANERAVMSIRIMDLGLRTIGSMMQSGSSEQEVLSVFPDINPLGDLIGQHIADATDRAVRSAESARKILETAGKTTSEVERRVGELGDKAIRVKADADIMGSDRGDIVNITRSLVEKRFKRQQIADLASRLPEEACGSIPQARHLATAVDIVVYGITANCRDAMDIADVLYGEEAFRKTGEWNDGEVICHTQGVSENLITQCQTPVGDIAFTGPGSA